MAICYNFPEVLTLTNYQIVTEQEEKKYPPRMVDYLNYLQTIKGKSPTTVLAYTYDLTVFLRFMKVYKSLVPKDVDFDGIDIADLDDQFFQSITLPNLYAYMSFVEKQRDNMSYARARKTASLRTFFKYLHAKARIIDYDPASDLESPRIKKRSPIYLTLDESVTLLKGMDQGDKDYYRDYCILTLFLNCGLRLSELISITRDMIREDTIRVIGKGNKERLVYLNRACIKAIADNLRTINLDGVLPEYKNHIFLSSHKRPISKRTVERLVKKHILNAGIQGDQYTPHKLRHTAATLMYKHGNVDIMSLQMILGHENLSTTQIYTHVDDEGLRESIKSNPLADIDEFKEDWNK